MNFILFAIVSGGIFFKEFDQFGPMNWLGFLFGVLMLFIGIILLSPKSKANSATVAPLTTDEAAHDEKSFARVSQSYRSSHQHHTSVFLISSLVAGYRN